MAQQAYILQDPTKALVLATQLVSQIFPGPPPSVVQANTTATGSTPGATFSCPFTSNVTAGNRIYVFIQYVATTLFLGAPSDSQGNGYASIPGSSVGNVGTGGIITTAYRGTASVTGPLTVTETITGGSGTSAIAISVVEVHGDGIIEQVQNVNGVGGSTFNGLNTTPNFNNELILYSISVQDTSGTGTLTASTTGGDTSTIVTQQFNDGSNTDILGLVGALQEATPSLFQSHTAFNQNLPGTGNSIMLTIQSPASPVPNGQLQFFSGNDSSLLATVNVTNPNGVEVHTVGYAFCDMALSDSVGSVWWNQSVTATYNQAGVTVGPSVGVYNLNDAWDAEEGSWWASLDPDGHSIWALPWSYDNFGGVQKYDLNTRTLTAQWGFPFTSQSAFGSTSMRAFEDGTAVFWQDNASHIYVMSSPLDSSHAPVSTNRIHKINPTTFAEIAAFGYDDNYPSGWDGTNHPINSVYTPTDWALYTRGGSDYLATSCDENTGGPATALGQIINLATMTVTALFAPEVDFVSPVLACHSVWVDKFGIVWWACEGHDTNLYLIKWNPADGTSGTYPLPYPQQPRLNNPVLAFTIPGANWQSSGAGSLGNFAFSHYQASNHTIVYGNFTGTLPSPNNGNASDLGVIDLATGNVTHFIDGTVSDPPPAYSGTVDIIDSCMRVYKANPWSTNTHFAVETCPPTTLTGNFQDGGVINLFDPTTLTLSASFNLTRICESTVTAALPYNGYTYQGVWSSGTNYSPKDIVTGSDGALYMAKVFTGPTAVDDSAADPAARSSGRPTNGYDWSGIPVELQHINGLPGSPAQAYAPHGGMLYVESQGAAVFAHEFVGSPLMMVTGLSLGVGTTTTVSAAPNPGTLGNAITITATVVQNSGPSVPTGSVQFVDNGTNIGPPQTLNGAGIAQLSWTYDGLNVGDLGVHPLTATYIPGAGFTSSPSNTVNETINPYVTSSLVVSSEAPSSFEDEVTFTVTVSDSATEAHIAPTGTVDFVADVTFGFGTETLAPLSATISAISATATVATYVGANSFAPGMTITVTGFNSPYTQFNQTRVLVATATANSFTVNGTYTVQAQVNQDGAATSTSTSSAAASTTVLLPGLHLIQAQYLGDSNHGASNSNSLIQQVIAVQTAITQDLPGFGLIASFSPNGDNLLPPQVQLFAAPSTASPHESVNLLWDSLNVAYIRITGNNTVDYQPAGFDTGFISTSGSGIYVVSNGFTANIRLTLQAYDVTQAPIAGIASSITITIT